MRTQRKRRPFASRKAAYRTVKGSLLQRERRPLVTRWNTIGYEQATEYGFIRLLLMVGG